MMKKSKRLVHLSLVDGTPDELEELRKQLCLMKDSGKIAEEYEFILTNDRLTSRDAKYLIEDLIKLMKRDRLLKEVNKNDEHITSNN